MVDYSPVAIPSTRDYAAPFVDFGIIGNLGNTYYEAQRNRREQDVATAFKDQPLPLDANGLPDYGKIMQVLASKGGIDAITKLAPSATEQSLINRAGQISPLLGGGGAAAPASGPSAAHTPGSGVSAPQSIPSQSIPAPPGATSSPSYVQSGDHPGSVVDIVSTKLPQDSPTTGAVINNIARSVGVDPNAPLSPEQSAAVSRRVDAYVARTSGRGAPAGPSGGSGGVLTPERLVQAGLTPERVANLGVADRIGGAAVADRFAPVQGGVAATPQVAPPPAAAAAPQVSAAPAQSTSQRLTPEVPLPPGFTDPQKAIIALRTEAARRSANPYDKQGPMLSQWADRIEASLQPVKIGQADTYVDPATGKVLAQGPMASAISHGGSSTTIDADAARYRQTGTLPPNMGRGIQGQAESAAIRQRAAEQEINEGGNPTDWPTRWQEYRARGVGMSTGERVRAAREENLNLILKVTDAAIPAALEQSAKVWRTGFVPLNKIIQGGEVMTSDPELRAFGMANLQLAEGWARAMNPTGVMRQDDREKALSFLSTADSPETYRRLVMQLKTQITRERDSIRSGEAMRKGDSAPAPGVAPDKPASKGGGWVDMQTPQGVTVRVREKAE